MRQYTVKSPFSFSKGKKWWDFLQLFKKLGKKLPEEKKKEYEFVGQEIISNDETPTKGPALFCWFTWSFTE